MLKISLLKPKGDQRTYNKSRSQNFWLRDVNSIESLQSLFVYPDVFWRWGGAGERRTGHWVLGKSNRAALPYTNQRLQEWNWQPWNEAHAMVRPNRRIPHIFYSLERPSNSVIPFTLTLLSYVLIRSVNHVTDSLKWLFKSDSLSIEFR